MSVYNLKIQKGLEALEVSNAGAATSNYRRLEARTDGWYDIDDAGVATRLGSGIIGGSISDNQIAFGASTTNSIEGSSNLTYDGSIVTLTGSLVVSKTSDGSGYLARFTSDKTSGAVVAAQISSTVTTYARGLNNLALGNTSSTTNNYSSIGFFGAAGSEHASIVSQCIDQTNDYGNISFYTGDVGGFLQRFKIDSDGGIFAYTLAAKSSETSILYYNDSTKEIVYGAAPGGALLWQDSGTYIEMVSTTDDLRLAAGNQLQFFDTTNYIEATVTNILNINGGTTVTFKIGGVSQFSLTDGVLLPTTDDDIDLGSTTYKFKDLWIDGIANLDGLKIGGQPGTAISTIHTTISSSDVALPTSKAVIDYVQSYAATGIDWIESVKDKDLNTPPGSPVVGDRYIISSAPTGAWVGHNLDVTEWDGSQWLFWDANEGFAAWIEDEDYVYIFNGTTWVKMLGMSSTINHNDLSNIDGGQSGQYYHLTQAQHTFVTSITSSATELNMLDGTTMVNQQVMFSNGTYITSDADLKFDGDKLTTKQLYITTPTAGVSDYDKFLVLDSTGLEVKTRTGAQVLSDIGAGTSNVSITNQGNDRIVTSTATTDQLNGEANFSFSGTLATLTTASLQITTVGQKIQWGDADTYIREVSDDILGIYYPTDTVKYTFAAAYATYAGVGDTTHESLTLGGAIVVSTHSMTAPTNGTMRYVSGSNRFEFYQGGAWVVYGTSSLTLANGTNDYVVTATGASAMTGESSLRFDGAGLLTVGTANSVKGTVALCGNTSGTVNMTVKAIAGAWTMTLPDSAGTSGYVLQTDGTGITSWVLNGASAVSVANQSDNRIITATATTDALNAEANLTFDGSTLALTGSQTISANLQLSSSSYFYIGVPATAGTWRWYVSGEELIVERCTTGGGSPVYTEAFRFAATA